MKLLDQSDVELVSGGWDPDEPYDNRSLTVPGLDVAGLPDCWAVGHGENCITERGHAIVDGSMVLSEDFGDEVAQAHIDGAAYIAFVAGAIATGGAAAGATGTAALFGSVAVASGAPAWVQSHDVRK